VRHIPHWYRRETLCKLARKVFHRRRFTLGMAQNDQRPAFALVNRIPDIFGRLPFGSFPANHQVQVIASDGGDDGIPAAL